MRVSNLNSVVSLCAAALLTTACGGGSSSAPATPGGAPALITLDGSSTVFPISEAVAEEFQKSVPNTRVTVGISGTGGGFQKFCRAETDISDASRPISATEIAACGAERRRVHGAAGRLRRHRHRRESEGVVDQRHHRGRAEDAVGARGAGQGDALEPGASELAGPRDPPVRRGRGLGHLRLLHRSHHRQGQGQPRRLHLERRRQRAGAGRQQRRARARFHPLRLLRREPRAAQAGAR